MKKIFSAILSSALVLSLAACGSKTITMQEIYDACQLDTMLENHENVRIQHTIDDTPYTDMYLTKEFSYEHIYYDTESWAFYMTDDSYYTYQDDSYHGLILLDENGLFDKASYRAEYYSSPMLDSLTLSEDIQSVTTKDGRITVTTVMSQEVLEEENIEEEGLISNSLEYVMDAKTLTPIQSGGVLNYDDGPNFKYDFTCTYDEDLPAELQGFLALDQQTEDLRTITLVFHSETGEETTASVQFPKGLPTGLTTIYGEIDEFEIYADAACTEPLVNSGDYTIDTTIHVKWIG